MSNRIRQPHEITIKELAGNFEHIIASGDARNGARKQLVYAADFTDPCGGSIDVRLRESLETTKWDLHLSCRDIGEAIKAYNEL